MSEDYAGKMRSVGDAARKAMQEINGEMGVSEMITCNKITCVCRSSRGMAALLWAACLGYWLFGGTALFWLGYWMFR